jgi:hydrogenase expression/formation protein HypC
MLPARSFSYIIVAKVSLFQLYSRTVDRYNNGMCLAIPSKVVKIDNMVATVDVYGARRDVSLLLMPEEVRLGDYVLVHAGFAIQKVEKRYAEDSLNLIQEVFGATEE